MAINNENKQVRSDTATIVADMMGVTPDYVRKVVKGERYNEAILDKYMKLLEGKNLLIEAVKKAVPFNN